MSPAFGPRRGVYIDVTEVAAPDEPLPSSAEVAYFESVDLLYRSLCTILFNYVPTSGHPGGSISSGRFMQAIVFDGADYDFSDPDREDADIVSYAAGHKAMGLYALWALRDELARVADSPLLPSDEKRRLRLEDLLGFRRNVINGTPLFRQYHSKALDGHPTPVTPFVRLATGASGVGLASSVGLAIGARDRFGSNAPRVHVMEGEGGLTPGRVAEVLAAAGTASLGNVVLHVDWNQSSIDSDRVTREGMRPGDYVQWDPMELLYLHDWNVIYVPKGHDFSQIFSAQRHALAMDNGQPSAIVYRTKKGWRYGVQGKASHGAGHGQCSEGFYSALAELTGDPKVVLPVCDDVDRPCTAQDSGPEVLETCFWEALGVVRASVERNRPMAQAVAGRLEMARERLERRARAPRAAAPSAGDAYELAARSARQKPPELRLEVGDHIALRQELGRALAHLNKISGGAFLVASADLLGSTSVSAIAAGHSDGYWNAQDNPDARMLSIGGICEDGSSGVLSGVSTFGHNVGVASSYAAFMAPLSHIAARLHAIGAQARQSVTGEPYKTLILVCAHSGLKTGEDGPTHADPQALQLLQENFPSGTAVTLTPWEPQEIWPLLASSLAARPAIIAPFVTRPPEPVLDREALGLAAAEEAVAGVYLLHPPQDSEDVTIVLQESAVTYAFVQETLPLLESAGIDAAVYYVASVELFDLLSVEERERIFPEERARRAIGITGFTLPTLYRWVHSQSGLQASLHPYRNGHYLSSGAGELVLAEAGLGGEGQFNAIRTYLETTRRRDGT